MKCDGYDMKVAREGSMMLEGKRIERKGLTEQMKNRYDRTMEQQSVEDSDETFDRRATSARGSHLKR